MKNPKWLLFPEFLLLIILTFATSSSYFDSQFLFYLKYTLLFILMAYFISILALYLYRKLKLRKVVFKGLFELVFIITIGVTFLGEIKLVKVYAVPEMATCDYFDLYDNLIYVSRSDTCPTIEKRVQNWEFIDHEAVFYSQTLEFHEIIGTTHPIDHYTWIYVAYDGPVMTQYIKRTYSTSVLPGVSSILPVLSEIIQTITLTEQTVQIDQTYYEQIDQMTLAEAKAFDFENYEWQKTYISDFSEEIDPETKSLTITMSMHGRDNLNPEESLIGEGILLQGAAEYEIYPYEGTGTIIQIEDQLITGWRQFVGGESFVYAKFNYSPYNPYQIYDNQLESTYLEDQIKDHSYSDYYNVYRVLNKENTYIGKSYRYELELVNFSMLHEQKTYYARYDISGVIKDPALSQRPFLFEVDQEHFLTDLSDLQTFYFRRSIPLVDLPILMMRGEIDI